MMTYELHPLCVLFPRMVGADFDALVADIAANGLRRPITLHDGMILDGGNRYRACIEAGVEPKFEGFHGGNLVSFVMSANLHRRHMTTGQQAAIVASAQDWAKAQTAGNPEWKGKASLSGNVAGLQTVADRAAESGASERTQRMADKVARADPKLAVQVAHGEVSLPKAVQRVEAKAGKPDPKHEAKRAEVEANATDAHGDFDPLAELERVQAELVSAQALVAAAEANDQKAEALKWRRAYDAAQREQSKYMELCDQAKKREAWASKQLTRCGKAVGQADPDKIAPSVEAFVRAHGKVAA